MGPKTHATMSIATFIMVIIAVCGFAAGVGKWAQHVEDMGEDVNKNTLRIETMQPALVEIKTDVRWIRAKLDEDTYPH